MAEINSLCAPPPPLVGGPNNGTIGTNEVLDVSSMVSDTYKVDIYPNPVSSILTVNVSGKELQGAIQLTDVTGRVVSVKKLAEGQYNYLLDVSQLNVGLYFVTVRVDREAPVVERVIVE